MTLEGTVEAASQLRTKLGNPSDFQRISKLFVESSMSMKHTSWAGVLAVRRILSPCSNYTL